MQQKIRVGLLFGGRSGEHEVSLASALSVYQALDKTRYDVTLIAIDKDGRWLLPEPQALLAHADDPMRIQLKTISRAFGVIPFPNEKQMVALNGDAPATGRNFEVILPILHGTYGEDGTVQGLLELMQIPYVGSGVLGSAVGMDKEVSRILLHAAGIPVVATEVLRRFDYKQDADTAEARLLAKFKFPFFVKPANAGSSVGVSKVKEASKLRAALLEAFAFDTKVLVEEGVNARELEVSVLGNEEPRASIVGEITPNHEFYSYEAKYLDTNGASLHIPAENLKPADAERIRELAIRAFRVLECRGLARVDFFMDRDTEKIYLNEINTLPGFTKVSMYPKLWNASGLTYPALLDELIRLALDHARERRALKTTYND